MLSAVRYAAEDNGPLTTDYGQLEQDKKNRQIDEV